MSFSRGFLSFGFGIIIAVFIQNVFGFKIDEWQFWLTMVIFAIIGNIIIDFLWKLR